MAEGLRERKKRQTRQHLSDVATALFLERGFDAVTIAEIAQVAEVSVNTVYNYFPTKEDLFLDRSSDVVGLLSRYVRGRHRGESAADAVLRELRIQVESVSSTVGLIEGYERFMRVVQEADSLKARLWYIQQDALVHLETTLREEAGCRPRRPAAPAGGRSALLGPLHPARPHRARDGRYRKPAEVSREALVLLDEMEDVLGDKVLNYARRAAE